MAFQRKWLILAAVAGLPLLALAIAWTQRQPIAKSVIDDALKDRGVPASYRIVRVGTKLQRLEKLVVGDPLRPDLTAQWAEVDTSLSWAGAEIKAVRAGGVRLRGRLQNGVVSFGSVDRLLPKPTGEPFVLPDINLALHDGELALGTPWGPVGLFVAGKGNTASAFVGKVALSAPSAKLGDVSAGRVQGLFDLAVRDRTITLGGPASFAAIDAKGAKLGPSRMQLTATSDESFRRISVGANGSGSIVRLPIGQSKSYRIELAAIREPAKDDSVEGKLWLDGVQPRPAEASRIAAALDGESGTPAQPLIAQLRNALQGLQRGGSAELAFGCATQSGCTIRPERYVSRSGASLAGSGPGFQWSKDGQLSHDGRYVLAGGGFPSATADLALRAGVWTAAIKVDPYSAGGARLSLAPIALRHDRRGLAVSSIATLDGPLGAGRLSGLRLPINLRPGVRPLSGCMAPRFDELELAGLRLQPGTLATCIIGNEARVAAPRLMGYLGKTPVTLSARSATVGFGKGGFAVDSLAVRLMNGAQPTLLDVSSLTGTLQAGGAKGRYSGASGRIGAVPLLLSEGQGTWLLDRGVFTTNAAVRVADANADYRFRPLVSDDFSLRLANNIITAGGTMREPKGRTAITSVDIVHRLGLGTGQAILSVPGLTFGKALQPEELTPITLGVIANVNGTVSGSGQIDWTPNGVTSTGNFRTEGMDMAAAFGPVAGLKGEIALSDLLGLVTPQGQRVTLAAVNPGIAVLDGEIRYQLLPGLKAQIEGGRWPFAGGWLILDPTLLDLNQSASRRLTFRVEQMDMSRFIAAMEFDNISATGIFDGELPMVFDKDGGRIEGGRLVARGGGTLSYVGEISNEKLGAMGRFAFDALKSIKYNRLSIDLEGAIDGDVITRISFAGVNQAPIQGVRASFPIPIKVTGLNNIPFIFNVTITAKFRQLFEMARSFNDPSVLINRLIPQLEPVPKEKRDPVQPSESGPKP